LEQGGTVTYKPLTRILDLISKRVQWNKSLLLIVCIIVLIPFNLN